MKNNTGQYPKLLPIHSTSLLSTIDLIHINGNHWVLLLLKAINRLKPLPPVIGAMKFVSQVTLGWRSELKEHFSRTSSSSRNCHMFFVFSPPSEARFASPKGET
ncbi:uncharacterized protein VP01_921g3 [Puccinia sorghi]|uniref:Uncharacterized protein n=1 Tax=Puccinia sorghi TaxID=27349 RepID=A0A0L6U7B2_9BASI|nr:uncharacterized protein VP01_921g3 [Puccinia sorghi]